MSDKTRHVVMVIADSLRYDSVWNSGGSNLPYIQSHSTTFHHAYSAGCWTLPATASMFTGLMPHQHQATTRSRGLDGKVPTLAAQMQRRGYETIQLTANTVTTHIFGLNRGFQRVERVWEHIDPGKIFFTNILVLLGKRRIREKFLHGDFITGKMTEDIQAGQTWAQSFASFQFQRAKEILEDADQRGKKVFLFINLMETHFPYHITSKFHLLSQDVIDKLRELLSMFHLVNQTWLTSEKRHIRQKMLNILRKRQQISWEWFSSEIDRFFYDLQQNHPESLLIFTADHGDNFGDEGWKYHFSNVTEAGNRVPLFVMGPDLSEDNDIHQPVTMRRLFDFILESADSLPLFKHFYGENIIPLLESYWYNRNGETLPKYRNDQLAFVYNDQRFVYRDAQWHAFSLGSYDSSEIEEIPVDANPIYDLSLRSSAQKQLIRQFEDFQNFSNNLSA